jgi:2-octaprenyl-6-methoxyphenol hydroxylase
MHRHFEAMVIGGGPAGLAAALALSDKGLAVGLVSGGRPPPGDGRCIAVMQRGLAFLSSLIPEFGDGVGVGTPLNTIRIIDATGALLRAPTVTFKAAEIDLPWFGLAVPADKLAARLRTEAENRGIAILDTALSRLIAGEHEVHLVCEDGTKLGAALVVGADGARSLVRAQAHIPARDWSYPQVALTCIVRHIRDHEDISTEFHTREGPFTLVPNGERESSIVWMVSPARARRLLALDDAAFAIAAERQCQSLLGAFTVKGRRGRYPMRGLLAADPTGRRVALVGEAAHVFPPIGAQGLNLGLRDVASLAKAMPAPGGDPGAADVLARYRADRRGDLTVRTVAVDALNRSLLSSFLPVQAARHLGFSLLGSVAPLRRLVMRAGMA